MESHVPKTRRELNREVRVGQILRAARELMEEAGADAVTLRKLAKKSGLTTNTIYAHFGNSRDNLINAIVMDAMADVGYMPDREVNLDEPGNTPWEMAVDQFLENPEFYRAVTLFRTQEVPLADAEPPMKKLSRKARDLLEEAVRDRLLSSDCDVAYLGRHFINAFRGYAHRWARREISGEEFRKALLYTIYTALFFNATPRGRSKFKKFLDQVG